MIVEKTNLDGVLLIKPKIFEDFRGNYVETYNEEEYAKNGIPQHFAGTGRDRDTGTRSEDQCHRSTGHCFHAQFCQSHADAVCIPAGFQLCHKCAAYGRKQSEDPLCAYPA